MSPASRPRGGQTARSPRNSSSHSEPSKHTSDARSKSSTCPNAKSFPGAWPPRTQVALGTHNDTFNYDQEGLQLRERFETFKRRDLYDVHVMALFRDATFSSVRASGPKKAFWSPGIHRGGSNSRGSATAGPISESSGSASTELEMPAPEDRATSAAGARTSPASDELRASAAHVGGLLHL